MERSPDTVKDQTYFLAYLSQEQLSHACFPIGKYTKQQMRSLAAKFNLSAKNRRDSQGLCFLGQIKFSDFIKQHLGEIKGDIIDIHREKKLGNHKGYYYYTIGQRQGLGLSHGPWYVVKKDIDNNIIYVSIQNRIEQECRDNFTAGNFNWLSGSTPSRRDLQVKIRHGVKIYKCRLDFKENDTAAVTLDKPDQGIAPGQTAVFYDGSICLGGGTILE
jgi:tRNA-specific 2-thiouridylase